MFEAQRIGYLPRPISRGMMTGNHFRIVVRTEEDISGSVEQVFRACVERKSRTSSATRGSAYAGWSTRGSVGRS